MKKYFSVYRSSAGSGKTYTLTKEYLKLALAAPDPQLQGQYDPYYYRHILTVTFTKDAAAEMKSRILSKLALFSDGKAYQNDPFCQDILRELPAQFPHLNFQEGEIQARAAALFTTILHHYSDFSVSTIDSFNKRIVQAFSKDLDLPQNFEIEMDTETVIEEAVHRLFQKVGTKGDKHLNEILTEFVLKNAEDDKSWNIEAALKDFARNLFKENTQDAIQKIYQLSNTDLKKVKAQYLEFIEEVETQHFTQIQEIAQQLLDVFAANNLKTEYFYHGSNGITTYLRNHTNFDYLKNNSFNNEKSKSCNTHISDKGMKLKKWAGTGRDVPNTAIEIIKGLTDDIEAVVGQIEAIKDRYRGAYMAAVQMRNQIYLIMTLKQVKQEMEWLKENKNQVYLSEFNEKINQIVEQEPVPYIYERVGERYKHILIDEFQDTSIKQWHNFIPLIANSLGYGFFNMVVGDAKQAIYRWRGGDASIIVHLPQLSSVPEASILKEHETVFEEQQQNQNLNTNRRSKKNIVEFNNNFFEYIKKAFTQSNPDLPKFFREVEQQAAGKEGGEVVVFRIGGEEKQDKNAGREAVFSKTLEVVERLNGQGYAFADIALLVRNNAEGAFLAEKFIEKGVPVISSESLLLNSSSIITFLVSFFELLKNFQQPTLKFHLLSFLEKHCKGKTDIRGQDYLDFAAPCNQNEEQALEDFISKRYQRRFHLASLRHLSLYELAEELIRIFDLFKAPNQQLYIQKFLDVVFDFIHKKNGNLVDFLEYWHRKKDTLSISSAPESQAIRIMSIHKSKGLEFPVVILPFADWSIHPKPNSPIWIEWEENNITSKLSTLLINPKKAFHDTVFQPFVVKEYQEVFIDNLSLLYVALTRPIDKLFIITPYKKITNKIGYDDIKDVSSLLNFYIERRDNLDRNIGKEEVVLASDTNKGETLKTHLKISKKELKLEKLISTEARHKIKVRKNNLRYDDSYIKVTDLYSSKKDGLLMHYAFEKIQYAQEVEKAVEALVDEGYIAKEEQKDLIFKIKSVISLPLIRQYYDRSYIQRVLNEREILIKGSKRVMRPDRLVIGKDRQLAIIDYKTGFPNEQYKEQISQYAAALSHMNFTKIRKFLVYTEQLKVEEVE
ncbi:UvrD-helicase domain-containing protein [Hugenholtzia roseola]|uniref:UvrD-helicase domain-containing protein n=1 Tax=Hugenholtzia roseola TaxID=1002 RepID=UPI00041D1687|nr:UvrD-helicase domain-containing protein [Hugenholtzia roseola]